TGSWPTIRPGSTGYSPLRMWTSVPQIVVSVTRTSASVGPTLGTGRSSSEILPGPRNTAARIVFARVCRAEVMVSVIVGNPHSARQAKSTAGGVGKLDLFHETLVK